MILKREINITHLGYKIIFLYDLSTHSAKATNDSYIQVIEDNARGIYRVAEKEKDLSDIPVFIC